MKKIVVAAVTACLTVTGCGKREPEEAKAKPEQNMAAQSHGSIMRPSVVEETEPEQSPKPVEPFRAKIYFAYGDVSLGADDQASLTSALKAAEADPGAAIVVRGHSGALGDEADNLKTSQMRADSVRDYLIDRGVPAARVTTVALGEAQSESGAPAGTDGAQGNANDRWVEIVIGPQTPAVKPPGGANR